MNIEDLCPSVSFLDLIAKAGGLWDSIQLEETHLVANDLDLLALRLYFIVVKCPNLCLTIA